MLILRRLLIWTIEILSQAIFFGFVMSTFGHDQGQFIKDGFISAFVVFMVFLSSGYLFTTIAFRALWKNGVWWSYSTIATSLFIFHFEIMNAEVRGAFPWHHRLVETVCACVVSVFTCVGTLVLRKWVMAREIRTTASSSAN